MSASAEEDAMICHLVDDIDTTMYKWLTTYEMPPLNLIAIMLARMTWLAKEGNCKEDFLELLRAPSQILEHNKENKDILH